jgi:hypothetical protein
VGTAHSFASKCGKSIELQWGPVRLLLLRLGTPVVHGVPVRDNRTAGTLLVSAAADQKAVCAYHGNGHSNPNIVHHLGGVVCATSPKDGMRDASLHS